MEHMTKDAQVTKYDFAQTDLEKIIIKGDLSPLNPQQKIQYYMKMCELTGLEPATKPFDLLNLKGKEVLYLNKAGAEQLRNNNGVSIINTRTEKIGDLFVYTAYGRNKAGREDVGTGAADMKGLSGDNAVNAILKAETKAKRRLTLSLCGLGLLDETEVDSIPGAIKVSGHDIIDKKTGEILVEAEKRWEAKKAKLDEDQLPDSFDKLPNADELTKEYEMDSLANPNDNFEGYSYRYELGFPEDLTKVQLAFTKKVGMVFDMVSGAWYSNEFFAKMKDKIRGPK